MSCMRRRVKKEHLVVRTERVAHTHIFSRVHVTRYQHIRVGLSVSCIVLCFFRKSFHLIHVSSRHACCTVVLTLPYTFSGTDTQSDEHSVSVISLPLRKKGCCLAAWLNKSLSHIFSTVAFLFEQKKHIRWGIASARASHEEQKSIVDQMRVKLAYFTC